VPELALSACAILVLIVNFLSSVGLALFGAHLLRIVSHELVRSMALRFDFSLPGGAAADAPVGQGDFEAWRCFGCFFMLFLCFCTIVRRSGMSSAVRIVQTLRSGEVCVSQIGLLASFRFAS
jgi:hypothetical protein